AALWSRAPSPIWRANQLCDSRFGRSSGAAWFAGIPAQGPLSTGAQHVGDPVEHVVYADCNVVDLTMMKATFVATEGLERFLFGTRRFKKLLGQLKRYLLIAGAVQQQKRAGHLLHDAVEPETFEFFQRSGAVGDAQHPLQMLGRYRKR